MRKTETEKMRTSFIPNAPNRVSKGNRTTKIELFQTIHVRYIYLRGYFRGCIGDENYYHQSVTKEKCEVHESDLPNFGTPRPIIEIACRCCDSSKIDEGLKNRVYIDNPVLF